MIFNTNIKIIFSSINKKSLFIYINFLINILKNQNQDFINFTLPNKKKKITLLKSPHVYKKAREQFQLTTFKHFFFFKNKNTIKYILKLLLNKPKVLKFKVVKYHKI